VEVNRGIQVSLYKRQVIISVESESENYAGTQEFDAVVAVCVLCSGAKDLEPRDAEEHSHVRILCAKVEER